MFLELIDNTCLKTLNIYPIIISMFLRSVIIIKRYFDLDTVEQKRLEKPRYFVYQSNLSDEIFIANQTQFWWNIMKNHFILPTKISSLGS